MKNLNNRLTPEDYKFIKQEVNRLFKIVHSKKRFDKWQRKDWRRRAWARVAKRLINSRIPPTPKQIRLDALRKQAQERRAQMATTYK